MPHRLPLQLGNCLYRGMGRPFITSACTDHRQKLALAKRSKRVRGAAFRVAFESGESFALLRDHAILIENC